MTSASRVALAAAVVVAGHRLAAQGAGKVAAAAGLAPSLHGTATATADRNVGSTAMKASTPTASQAAAPAASSAAAQAVAASAHPPMPRMAAKTTTSDGWDGWLVAMLSALVMLVGAIVVILFRSTRAIQATLPSSSRPRQARPAETSAQPWARPISAAKPAAAETTGEYPSTDPRALKTDPEPLARHHRGVVEKPHSGGVDSAGQEGLLKADERSLAPLEMLPDTSPGGHATRPESEAMFAARPLASTRLLVGPHASVVELLDRACQAFRHALQQSSAPASFPDTLRAADDVDAFCDVLAHYSAGESAVYRTATGDHIAIGSFEAWLDLFALTVLDPLSVRCSDWLLAGHDGDPASMEAGELLRDLLQYQIPQALQEAGVEPVPAFPFCGQVVDTASMRVIGSIRRRGYEQQVVGVRQYGLMRGRTIVRPAHVVTA